MREMTDLFANLLLRKLRFLVLIGFAGIIGVAAVNGWSWTTFIVILIAGVLLLLAWALFSFWIWFFRNAGRQETR